MKRFQIMGVALIVICVFCVVGVASAGALTTLLATWLVSGTEEAGESTTVTAKGTLLLEDQNAEKLGIKAAVSCEGELDGTVGEDGVGLITAVLSGGKTINKTALVETTEEPALVCKAETSCEGNSKVWAVHLPWSTLLELIEQEGKTFMIDLVVEGTGGKPGYYIECTIFGVKAFDECLGEGVSEAVNVAGGVEDIFSEELTLLFGSLASCTSSGGLTGDVEGKGTTTTGATLTTSSPLTTLLATWLVKGGAEEAAENTAVTTKGTLLLEDQNAEKLAIKAAVSCEGELDGTVGEDGVGLITVVLSGGKTINKTALVETAEEPALICKAETSCEGNSKVWAVHLPWSTLLELIEQEGKTFMIDLVVEGTGGKSGWYTECTIFGVKAFDECLGEGASEAANLTSSVEGIFSEALTLLFVKFATCSSSGGESGNVEGKGITTNNASGGTLAASSE